MNILLIAGHGAQDSGAVAKIDGVQYREADLTREVVSNLKKALENYGVNVSVYPTSHDAYTDYKNNKLTSFANFKSYNYVLEIHFNAGGSDLRGDGKIKGDECFWPSRGAATGLETPITSRLFTGSS
ncbi:MAG: N-acetylmuramoyl-L-alanine amidase [Prevotellaceae bacterium]|nr:N-acetylmuramoyl-L-alanine amidase [Candidatus Colivivens equi]